MVSEMLDFNEVGWAGACPCGDPQSASLDLSYHNEHLQSALVISNSKGLSEIHRDIRTSTYQISRIEKINSNSQVPQIHM